MVRELHDNAERRSIDPIGAEASRRLMPSAEDMANHFKIFKTPSAADDIPSQLLFTDPLNSEVKAIGHIDNAPEVSRGIQNLSDLQQLGHGIVDGPLQYLSTPNAVNDSLIQLGPVLDTAVNYYDQKLRTGNVQSFASDVNDFSQAIGQGIADASDKLQYPQDQKQVGKEAAAMAPFFIAGAKTPLADEVGIEGNIPLNNLGERLQWNTNIDTRVVERANQRWDTLGPPPRGREFHTEMGENLPTNTKGVDHWDPVNNIATSMKTRDLRLPTRQTYNDLYDVLRRDLKDDINDGGD
jgi:hypothetical protein